MKIYTKTGDKGTTGLIGGTRVNKSDLRLEAYGTVDELNSHIGMLIALGLDEEHKNFLLTIQNLLFSVGSSLATDTSKIDYKKESIINDTYICFVEKEIDRLDEELKSLKAFILPGGSQKAAQAHICRTVTRRAERRITEVNELFPIDNQTIVLINRLSDYFFALARYLLMKENKKEIIWNVPNM